MFKKLRGWLLYWVRVPLEPEPPFGDPRLVCSFRASRKLFYLRLIRWSFGQLAALAAILFWIGVVMFSEREAERIKSGGGTAMSNLKPGRNRITLEPLRMVPRVVFQGLWILKAVGMVVYLFQLAITYAAVRLDYELRWYIVTDRSLRIRSGLWTVQEITMSFANLQQVVISQGPLQWLLGISDVRVESAGGGGLGSAEQTRTRSMHAGVFHGVENAAQVRDLIFDRLRHYRETGVGDPDEVEQKPDAAEMRSATVAVAAGGVLEASRDLLKESKMLRAAWAGNSPRSAGE